MEGSITNKVQRIALTPTAKFLLSGAGAIVVVAWAVAFAVLGVLDSSSSRRYTAEMLESIASLEVQLQVTANTALGTTNAVNSFVSGGIVNSSNSAHSRERLGRLEAIFGPRLVDANPRVSGLYLAEGGQVSQHYPPDANDIVGNGSRVDATLCRNATGLAMTAVRSASNERHTAFCVPVRERINDSTSPLWGYAMITIPETAFLHDVNSERYFVSLVDGARLATSWALGSNETCDGSSDDALLSIVRISDAVQQWQVELCAHAKDKLLTPTAIAMCVFLPIVGMLLLLLIVKGIDAFASHRSRHVWQVHAPTVPPVAVVVVGVCGAEQLWAKYPRMMHHVTDAFEKRAAHNAAMHHGIIAESSLQHTVTIVVKDMSAALKMCLDVVDHFVASPMYVPDVSLHDEEAADNDPSDAFGGGGNVGTGGRSRDDTTDHPALNRTMVPVTITCVAHWCERISLRLHDATAERSCMECSGDDMSLVSRLFQFAHANAVVVSEAGKRQATSSNGKQQPYRPNNLMFERYGDVQLRGHRHTLSLFSVQDSTHTGVVIPPPAPEGELLAVRALRSNERTTLVSSSNKHGAGETHQVAVQINAAPMLNPLQSMTSRGNTDDESDAFPVGGVVTQGAAASQHRWESSTQITQGTRRNSIGITEAAAPELSLRKLLQRRIPRSLDNQFGNIFDDLAMFSPNLEYGDIKHVAYHYFSAFSTLFRPFAPAERQNMQRRLVTAFGVPLENFLENLAVRCALRQATEVDNLVRLQLTRKNSMSSSDDDEQ